MSEKDPQNAELTEVLLQTESARDEAYRQNAELTAQARRAAEEFQRTIEGFQRSLAKLEALRAGIQLFRAATASLKADKESLARELKRRAADEQSLRLELKRRAADEQSLRLELERRAADEESLRLELKRRAADEDSLRLELERRAADEDSLARELRRREQLQSDTDAILQAELHNLWNSWSWRVFRPLRNLARKLQGFGRETEPIFGSESQAIQTVVMIRQSLSWELTFPLRLIYRILPHRRRVTPSGVSSMLQQEETTPKK
ncbi:MAG: hypothetical protein ACLQDV_11815 [Candidatus Binataceae bacterium]